MKGEVPQFLESEITRYKNSNKNQVMVLDFNADNCDVKKCKRKSIYTVCIGSVMAKDVFSFSCKNHLSLKVNQAIKTKNKHYNKLRNNIITQFTKDAKEILGIK